MSVRLRRQTLFACLVIHAAACGSDAPTIEPRFDPMTPSVGDAASFFAFPFPSDRLRVDGTIDLSGFPYPFAGATLLTDYLAAASTLDGFSTSGGAYVRFDGALDATLLPTDPPAFLADDAPLAIIDVTADSTEYGARRPLRWQWWGPESIGNYVTPNMLGFAPAWGFPLREHTTYAAIVFDALVGAQGEALRAPPLLRALLEDRARAPRTTPPVDDATYQTLRAQYAPLRAWLAEEAIDTDTVVSATVFTTQTITADLDAIYAQIEDELPAPPMDDAQWQALDGDATPYSFMESFEFRQGAVADYHVLQGRYVAPNYQEGELPYMNEGGALHFVDGEPEPVFDETIRFVLTVPNTPPNEGLDCYPIVMYAHGTGGSANSMRYDDTAGRLAGRGIAAISIDQPFHAFRAAGQMIDVDLLSFNFFNVDSFRANFRQAAIDTFSLTRFVKASLRVPAIVSPTGSEITFCDDRVAFFGHSHGGLSGALAAPFEASIDDWVLSGAGGGFGITLLERKDILDFADLIKLFMNVREEEAFSETHPAITLLQTLADISDPANYASRWNHAPRGRRPASVLLTSGRHDEATPYRSAIALAVSAHMPVTTPVVIPAPEYDWLGLAHATPPLRGTSQGETLAFAQWTDDIDAPDYDTHFVIFNRPEAIEAANHFLETAVYDFGMPAASRVPTLDRDADADAR